MEALLDEKISEISPEVDTNTQDSNDSAFELKTLPPDYLLMPEPGIDTPIVRYGYQIGNMNFIIPENTISEIIQNATVFNLPNSPKWINGLVNMRGNIVPVISIHHVLGEKHAKNQKILALGKDDNLLAIMIDSLPVSLAELNDEKSLEITNTTILPFCKAVYQHNNQQWHEFDIQGFFKNLSRSS